MQDLLRETLIVCGSRRFWQDRKEEEQESALVQHFTGRRGKLRAGGEISTVNPEAVELTTVTIGTGATSRVFKGKYKPSGNDVVEVACKEFMVSFSMKQKLRMKKEMECMKRLRHPNILAHFGVDFDRSLLVTELLEKKVEIDGDLCTIHNAREFLDLHEFQPIPWSTRLQIMRGVTNGLSYLHENRIVHCDLKVGNIFIGDNGKDGYLVKLGDFGTALFDFSQFSVSVMPSATNTDSVMHTIAYTAPELLDRGSRPSYASDIYSLAMVMIEFTLPNRTTPWEGEVANSSVIYDFVRKGERPTVTFENLSELGCEKAAKWMSLLHECWQQDPSKRPTSAEVDLKMSALHEEELGNKNHISFQDWRSKNPNVVFTPLNTHQGMAVEVTDEVVSSFLSEGTTIPADLHHDLTKNLSVNDGSNACVYLCSKIAHDLLKYSKLNGQEKQFIIESVSSETIRKLPRHINTFRSMSDFAAVDEALAAMTKADIISTNYDAKELLEKQTSQSIEEKKNYLKKALTLLNQASNSDGKAFAIYLCPPLAILVGVIRSSFIIVDTHKVPEEAGGTQCGLSVRFDCEADQIETVVDNMVEWITIRMKASIPNYARQLHSLILLRESAISSCTSEFDLDVDDEQLLNASLELESNASLLTPTDSTGDNYSKNSPDQGVKKNQMEMERGSSHLFVADEQVSKRGQEVQGSVDVLKVTTEIESNQGHEELEARPPESIACASTGKSNYTLPDDLPNVNTDDLIVWKGHLTRFGLTEFKDFQLHAVHSVSLGRDAIVVQPTGSGKSLCFQLPSLIDHKKFVVVVSPTISLINSQIEGLQSLGIDAFSLGRAAGTEAHHNHERLFSTDAQRSFPSVVFMTPEHFINRVQYIFEENKEHIKLLVLDEVHKMFDRNSHFRSSYDSFKNIKDTFSGVPVMTLTATLSEEQLQSLCNDYLRSPVLIKGSINRSNIKLNIKPYVKPTKRKSDKTPKGKSEGDTWCACATDIKTIVNDEYAIVYMDFRSDVQLMTAALQRLLGEDNVRSFYGRGMTHAEKKKTDSDFRAKEFQVLVATEAYEVGTHSPHVDNIFRVGCMRNLSVIVQEFGRAGRSGNDADGFLLINESKDDQRLCFWTQNCSDIEEKRMKDKFGESWRWIYSLYSGRCLRDVLISKFGEGELELQCNDACCSSCDIKAKRDFNAKQAISLLVQAISDFEQLQNYKNGVKEEELIAWLRGSKRDKFSTPALQKLLDSSHTYSAGLELNGQKCSIDWWSRVLRQSINVEYVDINFVILRRETFRRVWRQYRVSEKGKQFLRCPCDVPVLDPAIDPFNEDKRQGDNKTREKRSGRGHHHLPKIQEALKHSDTWEKLTRKDQYEFPGFDNDSQLSQKPLAYVEDWRRLPFAASTRSHFMWDDNQLSKRHSQTNKHELIVEGQKTSLFVRRGPCEGVKTCAAPECEYVVSNRQKINRCVNHRENCSLISSGPCTSHMVYMWPCIDDGRRWVGVVPGTRHNHSKPAPHNVSSKVKEDIQRLISDDSSKKTKDIMKGLGLGYVPAEASSPAANADRVRKERKLALGKWNSVNKELRPLDEILQFDRIRKKVESNQLYEECSKNISDKVNEMMGHYQMEGSEYLFTPCRKYAFFMAPFQSAMLSTAEDIFIDITYTGNDFFPYLLNVVSFNDETCVYNAVARVLCSRQDSETYAKSITTIFHKVTADHARFSNGKNLRSILVDFDDGQYKGLQLCLGEELARKVVRGCKVHWQRSVNRVCKLVCRNESDSRVFKILASKIETEDEKENVLFLFDVLSGCRKLTEARKFFGNDLLPEFDTLDNKEWMKLKHWSKWWCRGNHLAMFTRAFKEMDDNDWEQGPSTTNPVESLNRQSFQDGGTIMHALMENIYLEDRLHAVKSAVCKENVTTSYKSSPAKQRTKRKRTSVGKCVDEGPPDKRRHILTSKRKANGRALINRLIEVEYDEKDKSGKVTKYWGWCKGQIVAYRKHEGYLVNFADRINSDGNVIEGCYLEVTRHNHHFTLAECAVASRCGKFEKQDYEPMDFWVWSHEV
ncbi:ATP-dependent DNA helicase RecQ [Stylophora pistillata]|uniref:DNA 3'-5' helicase n=1 Tax=Stylophora pistillata TaxID=50429 RepID=A0A2B4SSX2_STYPI|nr:ATP-dependent DNA helicase RecQ [Stylophora pistillata]